MKNGDLSAFPMAGKYESTSRAAPDYVAEFVTGGLSKREYFAGLAMQGIIACPGIDATGDRIVKTAVSYADALLAELEKEQ